MPRPRRIDFANARHHVMNRGARRQPIFVHDDCCVHFLRVLAELPERFGLEVHGYALMPNHFHLMVKSVNANLSDAMAYLTARYTRRVNKRYAWDGPVFRGRFHNRLVTEARHWRHLLAYLHLNPVRANLVMRLSQSRWTSHEAYLGISRPEWLTTSELLEELGSVEGYRRFIRSVQHKREETPEGFAAIAMTPFARRSTAAPVKSTPPKTPSVATALEQVCAVTGCAPEQLRQTRYGRHGNLARRVAAYWLVYEAKQSAKSAARLLDMHPVRVSQAIHEVRANRQKRRDIDSLVSALEAFDGGNS